MRHIFPQGSRFKFKTIENPKDRFLKHVNKTRTCWLWTASVLKTGYGQFRMNGKNWRAHRISWKFFKGPLPNFPYEICHKCDIRKCVRPGHLFSGTRSENMKDSSKKGRACLPHAILSEEDVIYIRKHITCGERGQKEIANKFKVHPITISRIVRYKTWKYLHI